MEVLKNWKLIAFAMVVATNLLCATFLYFSMQHTAQLTQKLAEADTIASAHVAEAQDFNARLGIAQSELIASKDLTAKYQAEITGMSSDFKALTGKYQLQLRSRDQTIASLRGQSAGGDTSVVVSNAPTQPGQVCEGKVISYFWKTSDGRFSLKDPDIAKKNDETFEYNQKFQITGYVFADPTGKLQIRKVELAEVEQHAGPDGRLVTTKIPNTNPTIVDSRFEYTNKIELSKKWTDVFHPRVLALFDTALHPGIGIEVLNLGHYWDWVNLGLYAKVGLDVSNQFSNIQKSTMGIGVAYHLMPPLFDSNVAIGASVNLPFDDLRKPVFTADFIFYLNN